MYTKKLKNSLRANLKETRDQESTGRFWYQSRTQRFASITGS